MLETHERCKIQPRAATLNPGKLYLPGALNWNAQVRTPYAGWLNSTQTPHLLRAFVLAKLEVHYGDKNESRMSQGPVHIFSSDEH